MATADANASKSKKELRDTVTLERHRQARNLDANKCGNYAELYAWSLLASILSDGQVQSTTGLQISGSKFQSSHSNSRELELTK